MKTPNYIFTPNRHKIILSASPFIIALTHTFFRMGGAQSGIIPSLITNILLGTSVIIGSLLELPSSCVDIFLRWHVQFHDVQRIGAQYNEGHEKGVLKIFLCDDLRLQA